MDQRTNTPVMVTASDDPEQIRRQILRTRREMAETINEIQGRLAPEVLRQQAEDSLREATVGKVEDMAQQTEAKMNSWRKDMMRTVRDNPVPVALIGIGAGWLLFSGRDDNDEYDYDGRFEWNGSPYARAGSGYGYSQDRSVSAAEEEAKMLNEVRNRAATMADDASDWAGDVADEARETMSEATQTAQRKVNRATDTVSDQAGELAESVRQTSAEWRESAMTSAEEAQARARRARRKMEWEAKYRARRAKRTFADMMDENPLAVGFAALAAGAMVGLVLPGTQRENELMGEQRDRLMEEVGATAQDAAERVQAVVEESRLAAMDAARKEARAQSEDIPVVDEAVKGATEHEGSGSSNKKLSNGAATTTSSQQKSPTEQAGERAQRASTR